MRRAQSPNSSPFPEICELFTSIWNEFLNPLWSYCNTYPVLRGGNKIEKLTSSGKYHESPGAFRSKIVNLLARSFSVREKGEGGRITGTYAKRYGGNR